MNANSHESDQLVLVQNGCVVLGMDDAPLSKSCIYCGAENPLPVRACVVCKSALVSEEEQAEARDEFLAGEEQPDVSRFEMNYAVENGFSYPDWEKLGAQVQKNFGEGEWWQAFNELAKRWLLQLKEDLGGYYRCYESENFLFLCGEGRAPSQTMLKYAEDALAGIEAQCRPLMTEKLYGKRAILAFSEQDDYYCYISHFHADGAHSLSVGIFLPGGYMHIAFPLNWVFSAKPILIHELVHNCIGHLQVPTWLHEGLAQRVERVAAGRGFTLDREMAAQHHEYWNERTIQEFWSGRSFYGSDERNKLSYSFAEILVELMSKDWANFLDFVLQSDYRDAGQDAALKILGCSLGDTVAGFLGPGDWRPKRKVIAEHWERDSKDRKVDTSALPSQTDAG
jgi:hypothetical protein